MAKQEIELEIITNGKPNLKLLPKEVAQILVMTLEQQIVDWIQKEGEADLT